MTAHTDQKARYQAYREAAQLVTRNGIHTAGIDWRLRVNDHASVQEVEDGAFVEATIWVPRTAIDGPPR